MALQAKKFVDQKIAIKINSYIPYFDFYVQFSDHGILFDEKAPEKAVDLDVRTTLMDLIKIFIFLLGHQCPCKLPFSNLITEWNE